jgi:hypothetical protein
MITVTSAVKGIFLGYVKILFLLAKSSAVLSP